MASAVLKKWCAICDVIIGKNYNYLQSKLSLFLLLKEIVTDESLQLSDTATTGSARYACDQCYRRLFDIQRLLALKERIKRDYWNTKVKRDAMIAKSVDEVSTSQAKGAEVKRRDSASSRGTTKTKKKDQASSMETDSDVIKEENDGGGQGSSGTQVSFTKNKQDDEEKDISHEEGVEDPSAGEDGFQIFHIKEEVMDDDYEEKNGTGLQTPSQLPEEQVDNSDANSSSESFTSVRHKPKDSLENQATPNSGSSAADVEQGCDGRASEMALSENCSEKKLDQDGVGNGESNNEGTNSDLLPKNVSATEGSGNVSTRSTADSTVKQPFKCNDCGKKYLRKESLLKHMRVHTGVKPHKCPFCEEAFAFNRSLNIHLKDHSGIKDFICTVCDQGFAHKRQLSRHKLIHTGQRRYECSICNKWFTSEDNLKQHMYVHTGEKKPHQCEQCGKSFIKASLLKLHMATHMDVKPYQCDLCEKSFAQSQQLKAHMQIHTGEKPHQCTTCEKKFCHKYQLVVHLRTHTGEKPYQCSVCERRFNQKSLLQSHMRSHTGEKRFECQICHKRFTQSHHVKKHMRTHENYDGVPGPDRVPGPGTSMMVQEANPILPTMAQGANASVPPVVQNPNLIMHGMEQGSYPDLPTILQAANQGLPPMVEGPNPVVPIMLYPASTSSSDC